MKRRDSDKQSNQTETPKDEVLFDLAEFFKVFGDTTRVKIMHSLLENEMCVNDIAERVHLNPSAVSHQLKILRQQKLVRYRKSGKSAIYFLADDHVKKILTMGLEHINE